MSESDIAALVVLDLREQIDENDLNKLKKHPHQWFSELCVLKRKTETQMTSSKTRVFQSYVDLCSGKITQDVYNEKLLEEKVWKTNASRFIQQIETRLQYAKNLQKDES